MISIDKSLVKKQFNSGLKSYAHQASVQKLIAQRLIQELCLLTQQPQSRIFEIGSGTGFLTQNIIEKLSFDELIVNDIAATSQVKINELEVKFGKEIPFIEGDAEEITFPEQLDTLISGSTIQWFKDISAFFTKVNKSLKPDGLFAFSTFGCQNFKEIKTLTGVGLDYLCLSDLCNLLSKEFNILLSTEWIEEKEFESPLEVLRHMKQTGVNGVQKNTFGRKQLSEFSLSYKALFANYNQGVTLTYNPIIIIAQKK